MIAAARMARWPAIGFAFAFALVAVAAKTVGCPFALAAVLVGVVRLSPWGNVGVPVVLCPRVGML